MSLDPRSLVRDVYKYSLEEFQAAWGSVREFILIEAVDKHHRPQGYAILQITQRYVADNDGAFCLGTYCGCSDEYYQWWTKNELVPGAYHHFCRAASMRACMLKVGRDEVIHVCRWASLTRPEAESLLKSWGFSMASMRRKLKPVTGGEQGHPDRPVGRTSSRQKAPAITQKEAEALAASKRKAKRKHVPSEDSEDEEVEEDSEPSEVLRRRAAPASGSKRPAALKTKDVKQQSAALDAMLDEEPEEHPDAKKAQEEAALRLASLKEHLNRKKALQKDKCPGDILARRASEVVEASAKKKKKNVDSKDAAVALLREALKKKQVVKDEVDYEEDKSESDPGSDGSELDVLAGDVVSSKSAAGRQRKLRMVSQQHPGKLLEKGFSTMHEQIGTFFGSLNKEASTTLSPVAVRYLLTFAMPQFQGGISPERYRELRTLATCLDMIVEGRTAEGADVLMQRFKGILMSIRDKSDAASRWIELLPFEDAPTASSQGEDFLARRMAVQHAKSDELLRKASRGAVC